MASGQIKDTNSRMSYIIPNDLKDRLEAYAKAEDRSVSKIVAYAIREYLDKYAPVPQPKTQDAEQNTP